MLTDSENTAAKRSAESNAEESNLESTSFSKKARFIRRRTMPVSTGRKSLRVDNVSSQTPSDQCRKTIVPDIYTLAAQESEASSQRRRSAMATLVVPPNYQLDSKAEVEMLKKELLKKDAEIAKLKKVSEKKETENKAIKYLYMITHSH